MAEQIRFNADPQRLPKKKLTKHGEIKEESIASARETFEIGEYQKSIEKDHTVSNEDLDALPAMPAKLWGSTMVKMKVLSDIKAFRSMAAYIDSLISREIKEMNSNERAVYQYGIEQEYKRRVQKVKSKK